MHFEATNDAGESYTEDKQINFSKEELEKMK
jgi:hypothetical protein